MMAQDCPVCERTPHADYCERGWDKEPVSLKRAVKIAFWIVAICFLGGAIMAIMGCTATESTETKCRAYGFSPETGKDSSWAVPCTQYGYHHHMNDTVGGLK